jgi:hypothetical protein
MTMFAPLDATRLVTDLDRDGYAIIPGASRCSDLRHRRFDGCVGGGQIRGAYAFKEPGEMFIDICAKGAARFDLGIGSARAKRGLDRLDRRRKGLSLSWSRRPRLLRSRRRNAEAA